MINKIDLKCREPKIEFFSNMADCVNWIKKYVDSRKTIWRPKNKGLSTFWPWILVFLNKEKNCLECELSTTKINTIKNTILKCNSSHFWRETVRFLILQKKSLKICNPYCCCTSNSPHYMSPHWPPVWPPSF